jgi:hypothetical protein
MKLIYEGKDITNEVEINEAQFLDCAGGKFDRIKIVFNNPSNDWSLWKPQKYHAIELINESVSSGKMFVAVVKQQGNAIILKAVPIKKMTKEKRTKSWENVTLQEILNEFAMRHGLNLKTYGTENFLYNRINQVNEADFEFLKKRCMIEGYSLKISNGNLIVFNEEEMERQQSITVTEQDIIGNFSYKTKEIYGAVKLVHGNIENFYPKQVQEGAVLMVDDLEVNSIGEAQRFGKNILNQHNKFEHTIGFDTRLNTNVAAGSMIVLKGLGLSDGKYFIYEKIDSYTEDKSSFCLRRIRG